MCMLYFTVLGNKELLVITGVYKQKHSKWYNITLSC